MSDLPVCAAVASALFAANIASDSGEDVDRFLAALAERGYVCAAPSPALTRKALAAALVKADLFAGPVDERVLSWAAAILSALGTPPPAGDDNPYWPDDGPPPPRGTGLMQPDYSPLSKTPPPSSTREETP